jgi:hypothetical protein
VSARATQHVRFFIVGTKVDKLAGSWEEHAWGRDAAVSKKLKAVEDDMRTVVANCCGAAALDITLLV